MVRTVVVIVSVLGCLMMVRTQSFSQASEELDERAKKVATPQQDSWKQVDEINKESDKTKARYQQAQQSNAQASRKSGYAVKKTKVGAGSAYQKPSSPKQKRETKKK